jgi:hypothetical protein
MTESPSATWAGLPRWSWKILGIALGMGVFLVGLIWLNRFALEQIRARQRYTLAFEDIDCPPPPGMKRSDFLGEVQYLGGMPGTVWLLDEDLTTRLAGAFARHPWVERVERVEKGRGHAVSVQLVYRTPVLAVLPERNQEGKKNPAILGGALPPKFVAGMVAVDAHGVVLPEAAVMGDLPILSGKIPRPAGPSGAPWGDSGVQSAARTADFLRPFQGRLRLQLFEVTRDGLVLTTAPEKRRAYVLWGRAPGEERADEASAALKLQRLLDYCTRHGHLGLPQGHASMSAGVVHDVRPRDKALHRPYAAPFHP